MDYVVDLVVKALAVLGGVGLIVGAVAAFFSKFFSDRFLEKYKSELSKETERLKGQITQEAETHKLKLKKQELVFNKEVEAAIEFFAISNEIRPEYAQPDMDWDDALISVVDNFAATESKLEKFAAKHGPFLGADIRKNVAECVSIASSEKFTAHGGGHGNIDGAKKGAEQLLDLIKAIEGQFVELIRS